MTITRPHRNSLLPLFALLACLGCTQQRPALDDDVRVRDDPSSGTNRFDNSRKQPPQTRKEPDTGPPDRPHPDPDKPSYRVITVTSSGVHNPSQSPGHIDGGLVMEGFNPTPSRAHHLQKDATVLMTPGWHNR